MATIPLITQPVSADRVQSALNALIDQINGFLSGLSPERVLITGGTIDGTIIGGSVPAAGSFTALSGTSGNISGDTIATLTAAQTFTNKILTSPVITGGTLNASTIGGVTPAAATFTAATINTSLTLTGGSKPSAAGLYGVTNSTISIVARNKDIAWFDSTASAVNFWGIINSNTGNPISIGASANSGDTDVGVNHYTKGAGIHNFITGGIAGAVAASVTSTGLQGAIGATTPSTGAFTTASATTFTGALTGNASTATALQTARTINGTSFDGTANITVTAAAGTLTGTTLNATVVSSSLTSVGTLATLTVTATITGSVSGNAATVTTNANLTGPVTSVGNATSVANNAITNAMIRQGVARSVIGVTGNATANVADIQGTANQILSVNNAGTALTFGSNMDAVIIGANSAAAGTFTTITGQTLNITGATVIANGLNLPGANILGFSTNTTQVGAFDASGRFIIGGITAQTITSGGPIPALQVLGTAVSTAGAVIARYSADANPLRMYLAKSRGASIGTQTVVVTGDQLGRIDIVGSDGTNFQISSQIICAAEGTIGAGQIPGNIVFLTANAAGTSTEALRLDSSQNVSLTNKITKYNNISTAGQGVPSIFAAGRVTARTAASAALAAYTLPAADGSFIVSGNVLVTASTTHSFTMTVTYTDEGNTSRTLTLNFSQITGTLLTAITNVQGVGAYEGLPVHIRCKASTAITFATVGTFTSVTYNAEGVITQIA